MRLRYETGITTFIQFVSLGLLNIATTVQAIITSCAKDSNQCVSNVLDNIIYFLVLTAWFGFLWLLGYVTQNRRGKLLALALAGAEGIVLLAALLDMRHHPNILGYFTSFVDASLAALTILLACRILFSSGGRIVGRNRLRKRRPPTV